MRRIVLLALCVTLSLTGLALAKGGTVYKGTTSQAGSTVSITVNKGKVTRFAAAFVCGRFPHPITFKNSGSFKIGKHGHFSGTATPFGAQISGKRSGKTITGSITLRSSHCVGTLTYTATTK